MWECLIAHGIQLNTFSLRLLRSFSLVAMLMQAIPTAASMKTESWLLWTYNIQLKGFRILLYGIAFVLPCL